MTAAVAKARRFAVEAAHRRAFRRAEEHARTCRACFAPIVADAEGNPGYASEACPEGARLLLLWTEAEARLLDAMDAAG